MLKPITGLLAFSFAVGVFMKTQTTGTSPMTRNIQSTTEILKRDVVETKKIWRPRSSAVSCPGKAETLDKAVFQSQAGEDVELMKYFSNLCNGTYMEMGALDGVTFSNSHAFHFGLGWKGLLLEASPRNYEQLVNNRPNELALVHAGVCAEASDLHWVEGKWSATGAFLEFATDVHKKNFFTEKTLQDAQVVKCKPLGDTLKETLGENLFFDFYSLDIEGAEFAALQTLDFSKVSFGIIFVETDGQNTMKDMAVRTLLETNGYRHLPTTQQQKRLGSTWFINNDWHNIYQDLIYAM